MSKLPKYEIKLPVKYHSISSNKKALVREEYIKRQKGLCYFCSALLKDKPANFALKKSINRELFPPNFFKWPIHLHHDRSTDLTIGAVHAYCNAILWQYYGE